MHGTEQRAQRQTSIKIVNLSLTEEQRAYNGERVAFTKNGTRMTGHIHVKK